MKKILLIVFILVYSQSFSQIKILNSDSEVIGKVQFISCSKNNNTFTFTYNDHKFTQIDEYKSFSLSENDFNELFNIITQGFLNYPKEEVKLELPNDILFLKFTKSMGIISLQITHFVNKNPELVGLTRYLTEKQVLKLFGKSK